MKGYHGEGVPDVMCITESGFFTFWSYFKLSKNALKKAQPHFGCARSIVVILNYRLLPHLLLMNQQASHI